MTEIQQEQLPLPAEAPRLPFWRRINPAAFAALALLTVFFLYQVVAGGILVIVAGKSLTGASPSFLRWATIAGQLCCILVPALILGRARYGGVRNAFAFHMPGLRQTLFAVLGVFALQQLLQVYMMAQDAIPLPPELKTLFDLLKKMFDEVYSAMAIARSPWEFIEVIVAIALVPAICEEMLFRGLIQKTMGEITSGLTAGLVTGAIFAFYHLNPIAIVPLVLLGCYFGYLVYRSGNILIGISAHFFNNFVACVATYMGVRDDFLVFAPHGNFTVPVILLNTAFFLVVFLLSTYYFIGVTKPQE